MVKYYITFSFKPSWQGFSYLTEDWNSIPSFLVTGNFPFPKFRCARGLPST